MPENAVVASSGYCGITRSTVIIKITTSVDVQHHEKIAIPRLEAVFLTEEIILGSIIKNISAHTATISLLNTVMYIL